MSYPLISVIIPIYNVEKYIRQCIDSVIGQTYKNLEIILVDDGSLDNSPQICDEYAQRDNRIKVIHKENGHVSSARNVGIDASTGEFIMFTDSDDFIDRNMVEDLLALQVKTLADISCCEVKRYVNGESIQITHTHLDASITEFDRDTLLRKLITLKIDCGPCNKLFKRNIIGNNRFIIGRSNEDYIFLFFIYLSCNKVTYTNRAYYNYRVTPGSVTQTFSSKSLDVLKNAIDIENYIYKHGLDYRTEIHWYKVRVCMSLVWRIKRNHAKKKYSAIYQYCKQCVLDNVLFVFFDKHYSLRMKGTTILGLL